MSSEVHMFINEQLISHSNLITIADISDKFKLDAYSAKKEMFHYYTSTKNMDVKCLIVCEYSGGMVKVVGNLDHVQKEGLTDVFIYGFNPSDKVSFANSVRANPTLLNPYTLVVTEDDVVSADTNKVARSQTIETRNGGQTRPSVRENKTYPQTTVDSGVDTAAVKQYGKKQRENTEKFSNVLKSTSILAKMREDRERKERKRQEELRKRKERSTVVPAEKQQQLEKLSKLFDSDSDYDMENKDEGSSGGAAACELSDPTAAAASPVRPTPPQIDTSNKTVDLEELLETTADDSIVISSQKPDSEMSGSRSYPVEQPAPQPAPQPEPQQETYIDDDGYIVTKRAQKTTPVTNGDVHTTSSAVKRSVMSETQPSKSRSIAGPKKKVQASLMTFFKKK
ncbi:DNA polymerase delta subunit POL32 Ecym_1380 [Eremothecium cymbalariae DBVPG|uniref:DNA polymerase delta subunit 3 n=1 Tax=Eremothecium cymbalariae (strain CBS 270.75 / DBVPG 7215 / KCTC 17166 / NRRL Y-17582) TaxID=931890 RepID=G8JNE9_ERECY|nr:hypothetical protein Ecym_1380 [Eremothecium cymbalariae DBVPG\